MKRDRDFHLESKSSGRIDDGRCNGRRRCHIVVVVRRAASASDGPAVPELDVGQSDYDMVVACVAAAAFMSPQPLDPPSPSPSEPIAAPSRTV